MHCHQIKFLLLGRQIFVCMKKLKKVRTKKKLNFNDKNYFCFYPIAFKTYFLQTRGVYCSIKAITTRSRFNADE